MARQLVQTDAVILDELSYLLFPASGDALLFHLISQLNEKTSLIITTNLWKGAKNTSKPKPWCVIEISAYCASRTARVHDEAAAASQPRLLFRLALAGVAVDHRTIDRDEAIHDVG